MSTPPIRRARVARIGTCATALAACLLTPPLAAQTSAEDLKPLIEQIAKGDDVQSREAVQRLHKRLLDPLVGAIGTLENRPPAEQRRLRQAVARLTAELHYRLRRADLPTEERALLDAFAASYDEIVQQLFDANYKVRLAAVGQIPLERGSGAGVLIALKVDDEDEDVADAALDAAKRLKDEVVARNLARYVHDAVGALRGGHVHPPGGEIAQALAQLVCRACDVIGDSAYAPASAAVIEALEYLRTTPLWAMNELEKATLALGRLGDPRAAPLLVGMLEDERLVRIAGREGKPTLVQTLGDLALLSLTRIYQRYPKEFGLADSDSPARDFAGYETPARRAEGVAAFRKWHAENAGRSVASQPASAPTQPPAPAPAGAP